MSWPGQATHLLHDLERAWYEGHAASAKALNPYAPTSGEACDIERGDVINLPDAQFQGAFFLITRVDRTPGETVRFFGVEVRDDFIPTSDAPQNIDRTVEYHAGINFVRKADRK